ncbi:MAG: cysteine desulfurase NifS [Candidatus Marinimicrobia bacterium]|nr:cysteine desulfurase NifS [Candidatus Neomarinimicrobiota bacterium]
MKKIYCDISATTPVNEQVIDLMTSIHKSTFGNPSSVHKYGQESHIVIEKARIETAQALNCHQEEIIFTASGTEANNIALEGLVESNNHIISSTYEHPSIMNVIKNLEQKGAKLTLLKPNQNGQVEPKKIEKEISKNTRLITVMFANNELGSINNIKKIAEITQKHNIILHVDAVQCVGKIPIDLEEIKIDMMSLSAHKFYGPKGVGALFVRKGIDLKTILNGGGQELNLRPGTENIAGIAGLGLALSMAANHLKENMLYVKKLEQLFIKEIDNYKINYVLHIKDRLPGVLAIGFPGIDGQSLLISLDLKGIAVSFGSACSSGTTKASQILLDAGITEDLAKSTLRISFGKIHTEEDIKYVAKELSIILKRLEKKSYA